MSFRGLPLLSPRRLPLLSPRRLPLLSPRRLPLLSPRRLPLLSPRRLPLVAALLALTAIVTGLGPVGAPTAEAATSATRYRIDLADGNDFVPQTNFVQCVGSSMQMMLNISGANDRTAATQRQLQTLARGLSGPTRDGFERKGASVRGWAAGLNELDAGPYRLVGASTVDEALRIAARSIRETGKPVGLLVWAGRHAWVMSGFEATADPGATDDFTVTRAIVLDPLYPFGSATWGRSPKPREAITPAVLGRQFVPRRGGTWAGALSDATSASEMAALSGNYVLVLPYLPRPIARDRAVAI